MDGRVERTEPPRPAPELSTAEALCELYDLINVVETMTKAYENAGAGGVRVNLRADGSGELYVGKLAPDYSWSGYARGFDPVVTWPRLCDAPAAIEEALPRIEELLEEMEGRLVSLIALRSAREKLARSGLKPSDKPWKDDGTVSGRISSSGGGIFGTMSITEAGGGRGAEPKSAIVGGATAADVWRYSAFDIESTPFRSRTCYGYDGHRLPDLPPELKLPDDKRGASRFDYRGLVSSVVHDSISVILPKSSPKVTAEVKRLIAGGAPKSHVEDMRALFEPKRR
jgi:hypothetical protein